MIQPSIDESAAVSGVRLEPLLEIRERERSPGGQRCGRDGGGISRRAHPAVRLDTIRINRVGA